jgi:hypothetical protein
VRRWASTDKREEINPKELTVTPSWAKPPQVLSANAGMHRWVWDLHYPPPAVLKRNLPISAILHETPFAPEGPRALPGDYTVKLTAGGKTLTQKFTVKMDPRVTTTAAGLAQQFDTEMKIADALRQDFDTLQQVRSVREQLRNLLMPAKSLPADLSGPINDLEKSLAALEGPPRQSGQRATSDNLTGLNSSLETLDNTVDSADTAPTSQALNTLGELQAALPPLLAKWNEIKSRDIEALNTKLRAANLQPIRLP